MHNVSSGENPHVEKILTPDAIKFLTKLHRNFDPERRVLLQMRTSRQNKIDNGELPNFLTETAHIRRDKSWRVAPIPRDLQDRRVEITGPVDRKTIINALNSGANGFMADFEDATSPTWKNIIDGQINLYDAVRKTIALNTEKGEYKLNDQTATLWVRPRGWHLNEDNFIVDNASMSASLFDFGLFIFHNGEKLLSRNTAPCAYLPKIESHLEARLWCNVIEYVENECDLPVGSIRVTVLIETLTAAFEAEEILYELKDYIAALNCGRWDYIFSYIKKLRNHPSYALPDRADVNMQSPFMRAYTKYIINVCHKRGAFAMGGMAAQIPIKNDAAANDIAMSRVLADKEREAGQGHDGTWVAHPDLINIAKSAFKKTNQLSVIPDISDINQQSMLTPPSGSITESGQRHNIRVALIYFANWLGGVGCVPINNLMEDLATAEICRVQLWYAIHQNVHLNDGRVFNIEFFNTLFSQEYEALSSQTTLQYLSQAKEKLYNLCISSKLIEFAG